MKDQTLILPVIHMNGTSLEMLLNDNLEAHRACERAIEIAHKAEFNPRDYYCHPVGGAWDTAVKQRMERIQALRDASAYFLALAEHAQNVICEKEARRKAVFDATANETK